MMRQSTASSSHAHSSYKHDSSSHATPHPVVQPHQAVTGHDTIPAPIERSRSRFKMNGSRRKSKMDLTNERQAGIRVWGEDKWLTLKVDWGGGSYYKNALSLDAKQNSSDGASKRHQWLESWLRPVFELSTLMELLTYRRVCKNWKRSVSSLMTLNLGSFWHIVGRPEFNERMLQLQTLFPNTTCLKLGYCNQITDDALRLILEKSRGQLEILDLFYCFKLTSTGVAHILEFCPNLRHLVLSHCTEVDNRSLEHLRKLKHLKDLEMSSLAKLDAGIWKTFHEHKFPSLERIHLEHCNKVNIFGDGEGNVDDAIEIKDGKCIFSCEANTFEIIVSERIVEEDDDEDGQDGDEDEDCLDVESEIEPEVGGDISEGGEDRNNSKAFKEKDR